MEVGDYIVHVVDDEEPVRKSLAFLLTTAGFTVRVHDSASNFLADRTQDRQCLPGDGPAHARHERHRPDP